MISGLVKVTLEVFLTIPLLGVGICGGGIFMWIVVSSTYEIILLLVEKTL